MNGAPRRKAPVTYEEQQAAYDQEVARGRLKDISIDIPKDPEVNPEVYRDVEPMLFQGFITQVAAIGEAVFVFKSLNQHEQSYLRMMGVFEKGASYRLWDTLLAYNVLMIDGENVLVDRHRLIPKVSAAFSDMEPRAKEVIIRHMSEINRRANNAILLTECYAMEYYSRVRWLQLRGLDLCSPSVTGIPGTDALGLNIAQLAWRIFNYLEDRNEEAEREWENAKFIGGCFAGKSVQKLYDQDHERRRKEKEERFAKKDKILRQVLLGEKPGEKFRQQVNGVALTGARTVEELATQLESDLKGEKDWHDKVVEEHERRIKENIQGRQQQIQQLSEHHEQEFQGRNVVGVTDFTGLSAAEVQERILHRKQYEAQQQARQMLRPDIVSDEKSRQFLDRWGITNNEVQFSVGETDRDTSTAVPIPIPRQGGKPPGRK